jgi:diguanylate cyclase (GGDEF)-like protein/PAS domain S-box-containing protein
LPASEAEALRTEVARLNKIADALMDRAERNVNPQGSAYDAFRSTILLEDEVRRRTEELKCAIREKERLFAALQISEEKFRSIVYQPIVGISTIEDGRFTFANPKMAGIFGYSSDEIIGLSILEIVAECDRPMVANLIARRESGKLDRVDYVFQGKRKDGELINVECHSAVMTINGKRTLLGVLNDVTEQAQAEQKVRALQEQLQEQAIRDPLTGLYNRHPLNDLFEREISLANRYDRRLCVVMGDLDHFKRVNDTYGHLAGDEILKRFAARLRAAFRATDIFCRFGGEEFLVLLPDSDLASAMERTEALRAAIAAAPACYNQASILVTASFGVSCYPDDGHDLNALIAAADRALYAAKQAGRNQVKRASG